MTEKLDFGGREALVKLANQVVPGMKPFERHVQLNPMLGVIAEAQGPPSAFSSEHRSSLALVQYSGTWLTDTAKMAVISQQKRMFNAMKPYWGTRSFYNYKDNRLEDWESSYWGETSVARLRETKCSYDPHGMFSTMTQSIPVSEACSTEKWCLSR